MDQLVTQLANAIKVKPAEIRDYREARDGGYNVVLQNYQKYRNIQPLEEDPPEDIPFEDIPSAESVKSAESVVVPGTEELYIPEGLQKAYSNPKRATIAVLKELCDLLEIDLRGKPTKRRIVKLVEDWKKEHAP
jgi:hypothetical protein